ncbi:MAG: DNA N-6-adenine-methyltransferase [Chloroflexota bacterium]
MPQRSLASLKRKQEQLQQEGILQDCWIEYSKPGGTAKGKGRYGKLRSRTPFANGCKSRYLKDAEIELFQRLIDNGRELKKIKREIAWLETRKRKPHEAKCSSVSDEWYTPSEYIEMARQVMGRISLDPASNEVAQQWIRAKQWYGIKDNGLEQPWQGNLWLNPPFGAGLAAAFTGKAIQEYEAGNITQAVILVRPAVAATWYMKLASTYISCTTHHRIRFIDKNGQQQRSPTHGNVFFYLGTESERFREVFSTIGVVSRPM